MLSSCACRLWAVCVIRTDESVTASQEGAGFISGATRESSAHVCAQLIGLSPTAAARLRAWWVGRRKRRKVPALRHRPTLLFSSYMRRHCSWCILRLSPMRVGAAVRVFARIDWRMPRRSCCVGASRVQRISDLDDECERLLGVYVVQGIIDDALLECAVAMPGDSGARMREVLAVSSESVVIEAELQAVLAEHPERKNRCALWGRSLVGDALLIVRSLRGAVSAPDATVQGFTHVITRHSQRMDALGLTA